jgi:cytochrome c-type biogenesis protein CcmH/NrfF
MRSRLMKVAQATALAVAVCFSLGATDANARYYDLGHRMMCICGCAQLVGECNHVGCTQSGEELALLRTDIAAGMGDKEILAAFATKYGSTVLAAPSAHGFDLVAWIAPFAVFAAALLGTILLIKRWSGISAAKAKVAAANAPIETAADVERRERIRRETSFDTGMDGGR